MENSALLTAKGEYGTFDYVRVYDEHPSTDEWLGNIISAMYSGKLEMRERLRLEYVTSLECREAP